MENNEIDELLNVSGVPCLSVLIPIHGVSSDIVKDEAVFHIELKKEINKAKDFFMKVYSNRNNDDIIKNIDELTDTIGFTNSKGGMGIFVSPYIAQSVNFPFTIQEKIFVGENFDSRDLLFYKNNIIDYCVLSISKKFLRLYSGKGNDLHEIRNSDFPINYVDTFEYEKPSRGNSYASNSLKDFEKDKSVLEEIRLVDFLRTADHLIGKYVNNHLPLIVSGGSKEIADFLQITQHLKRVIGKVSGNYNFNGDGTLANLAWKEVQDYIDKQNKILISNLKEVFGKDLLASGIENVWKAANEGKGLALIVEKDFECSAYISEDGYDLKIKKTKEDKNYIKVDNAVERVIKVVKDKKGKITFVDNGEMSEFNRIALQLRYSV